MAIELRTILRADIHNQAQWHHERTATTQGNTELQRKAVHHDWYTHLWHVAQRTCSCWPSFCHCSSPSLDPVFSILCSPANSCNGCVTRLAWWWAFGCSSTLTAGWQAARSTTKGRVECQSFPASTQPIHSKSYAVPSRGCRCLWVPQGPRTELQGRN